MAKLTGAVVGAGNYGRFVLQRLTGQFGKDLSGKIENIFVVDPNETVLGQVGMDFDLPLENRLKDIEQVPKEKIDFAVICSPATLHYDAAVPFITSRIPTFVAKPLDADYEKARKLSELAEQHGTINATGSQMLFHPAFTEAIKYIKENNIKIKQVQINWNKERGPRDHPIPGITVEEGSHPFDIISVLKPTLPSRIYAIERQGEIIIDPEKWQNYTNRADTKAIGRARYNCRDYVLAEIATASTALLWYNDGTTATIQNDFEDPLKRRTVHIVGESPGGERFHRSVAVYLDLTDVDKKEDAPYVRNGITILKGCKGVRSGLGRIIRNDAMDDSDSLGSQLEAFLNYAITKEKQDGLTSFNDEIRVNKLIEATVRSAKLNKELRYARDDYV